MRLHYSVVVRLGARAFRAFLMRDLERARALWRLMRLAATFHLVPANSEEV
ncbi:MAG TPA: hypothetical protein VEO56_12100 [Bacteroidota bacterium]|nr:hypothetical protein [Bacteroidota bacterium]